MMFFLGSSLWWARMLDSEAAPGGMAHEGRDGACRR